jgi:hypothetical protein
MPAAGRVCEPAGVARAADAVFEPRKTRKTRKAAEARQSVWELSVFSVFSVAKN